MDTSPKDDSPEMKVFTCYFSKLVNSIAQPEWLAAELYSGDVISKRLRDEAIRGSSLRHRTTRLLAGIGDQIVEVPSVLHKFLLVMRRDPSLVYIADAMSDHCCECCTYLL